MNRNRSPLTAVANHPWRVRVTSCKLYSAHLYSLGWTSRPTGIHKAISIYWLGNFISIAQHLFDTFLRGSSTHLCSHLSLNQPNQRCTITFKTLVDWVLETELLSDDVTNPQQIHDGIAWSVSTWLWHHTSSARVGLAMAQNHILLKQLM